jgi:hypothetical protein
LLVAGVGVGEGGGEFRDGAGLDAQKWGGGLCLGTWVGVFGVGGRVGEA